MTDTKNMMTKKAILIFTSLATLIGCGTAKPALDTARLLSAHTSTVQKEGEKFSNYLEASAKGRQKHLLRLKKTTVESEFSNTETQIGWKIDKQKTQTALLKSILDVTQRIQENNNGIAQLEASMKSAIEATKSKTNFQTTELNNSAKTLAQLGTEPSLKDQLKFLLGFLKDVQSSIKESNKTAKSSSEEAAKSSSEEIVK